MKKLLMVALSLLMMVTFVACSSPSKKYDEDINKILLRKEANRNNVNIKVYENIDVKTNKVSGVHTVYVIFETYTGSEGKEKINDGQGFVISKTSGEVISMRDKYTQPIINSNKPVYEETNIKLVEG